MPRLSGWFIRAALVYLAVGFTFGALMLAEKGVNFYPTASRILPIHMEVLLVGWLVQLAIGMAFWILPRFPSGPPRGNETLVWLAFVLINIGIGCVIADTIFKMPVLTLIGRAAEVGGVLAFGIGSWRRVRPTYP